MENTRLICESNDVLLGFILIGSCVFERVVPVGWLVGILEGRLVG